eukprot:gene12066-8621_t
MTVYILSVILAYLVPYTLCASLLGVGVTKSGGLEIADASFAFLPPNAEGLTRLSGKGLAIELDTLGIRTSHGQLTMTPTSIAFKKGTATWQSLYYDERMEFRRNNDILLHVIAAGKAENFQYRFLGTGYFHDLYVDQVEISKALGMLCRADKSLAAQKRLDSSVCRAEMTEMHLSLTQQLEMIARIVSSLTDMQFSDANRKGNNNNNSPDLLRQAKQEMTDGLIKEIDRRLAESHTNFLRQQAERNRTTFEQSQREFTEMRQRIEGISIAVADKWKEFAAQQVHQLNNVSRIHERLDALSQVSAQFDGRLSNFSRLMGEQILSQQTRFTERVEGTVVELTANLTALQAHIHEHVGTQLQQLVKVTVPKMVAESEYKLEAAFMTQVATVSAEMHQTVTTLNDTWQDQQRRHRDLLANGLNTTLSLAQEFTQQQLHASVTRVVTDTQTALAEAVTRVQQNLSDAFQANLTAVAQNLTGQLSSLHENASLSLTALRDELAVQGQQQNDSLVAWQRTFNVTSVEAQIDRAIEQWNTTLLHPSLSLVHHTFREQQAKEALAWRTQLANATFLLNDTLTQHTLDQVQQLATTVHTQVSANLSSLNDTLHQSLLIWHRTWNTTKQHIDVALAQTQHDVAEATTRNLTTATVQWQTMERQLQHAMASLDGHVTQTVHNLTVATQTVAQALGQNMSAMATVFDTQQTQLRLNVTLQLAQQEGLMTRALQDDAHKRYEERLNYTAALQQRFIDHETRWQVEQGRWSNHTDAMIRHVHQEIRTMQADVTNTTTTWTQRWVHVHGEVAVLQQRTVDDHATLQTQGQLLQTQTTQLALVAQTQTEHVVPALHSWQSQWKNWTEGTWPRWQQETLLWRQDFSQRAIVWSDATKQCQSRVDSLEKEVRSVRETVVVLERAEEQRRREQEAKDKHTAEEMKRLRSELDAAKATVSVLQREQEKLKVQQERMQETLLNQVLLLMRTQQLPQQQQRT